MLVYQRVQKYDVQAERHTYGLSLVGCSAFPLDSWNTWILELGYELDPSKYPSIPNDPMLVHMAVCQNLVPL